MTKDRMKEQDISHVIAELAEDVFDYDVDMVNEELIEAGEDPEEVSRRMRSLIGKALLQDARKQIDAAKNDSKNDRKENNVVDFAPGAARAKLAEIVGRDPALYPELTMAARKGEFLSDADAESQLQDLIELGAISRDDLE